MLKDSLYSADPNELLDQLVTGRLAGLWTALPGIVQSFDPAALTCEVQPAIQGKQRNEDGSIKVVNLPILLDCPVVFPHAGGCSLTFPIKPGDECLVVFSARAIDLWWQSGGVQPPVETRMHDLSDGFVIPGPYSQPKVIPEVSTEYVELRNDTRQAWIAIHPETNEIKLETRGDVNAVIDGNLNASVQGTTTASLQGAVSISCGSTLSAEVAGATSLKCPSLMIDCPNTTFTGNVAIQGALTVAQRITGSGGLAVSGGGGAVVTGDVVADGISLKTHTHTEQGDGNETSGPH